MVTTKFQELFWKSSAVDLKDILDLRCLWVWKGVYAYILCIHFHTIHCDHFQLVATSAPLHHYCSRHLLCESCSDSSSLRYYPTLLSCHSILSCFQLEWNRARVLTLHCCICAHLWRLSLLWERQSSLQYINNPDELELSSHLTRTKLLQYKHTTSLNQLQHKPKQKKSFGITYWDRWME